MPRSRTPPEVARSRIRLLRTAADLFARQGYKATSVDQIVAAAGYTRGALYWHFPNKADLFLAVYEASVEEMSRSIVSRVGGPATCRERLERAVVAVIEGAALHHQTRALHRAYLQEFGPRREKRSTGLAEQFRIFESELTKIVAAGVKRGEFPPLDPELTSIQLVGTVAAVADAIIENPDRFDGANVARATAGYCLRALGSEPTAEGPAPSLI